MCDAVSRCSLHMELCTSGCFQLTKLAAMSSLKLSSGQADAVLKSVVSEDQISSDVKDALRIFLQKLTENGR